MPEPRSKEQELAEYRTAHAPVQAGGEPAIWHVQEHDDHFVVTYADGKSTSVTKEGLKKDTLAHIQGMAHGGEVRALAGGRVDPGGADGPDSGGRTAEEDLIARSEAALVEPALKRPPGHPATTPTDDDLPPERRPEPANFAQGGEVAAAPPPLPQMSGDLGDLDPSITEQLMGGPPQARDLFAVPPLHNAMDYLQGNTPLESPAGRALSSVGYAPPPGGQYDPITGTRRPEPAPPGGMIDLRGAPRPPAPATASAPPPSGLPLPPSGSGALTDLNKGLAEERAGLAAQVEAEKQRDAALMKLQDSYIAQMQSLDAASAEQLQAHQRRADNLFQATLNAKIDPNRVWSSADVGQKMAAGIGIILSGIGQGLAGGPNMALQVIDRTIDRDIDAQKNNLENQRNLLTHYLQQGRDMISAQQLVKADLKDMYAAHVQRVSAEFGGQDAAARAQLAGGQLRTEAASKRQEILGRDFVMAKERLSMQLAQEQNRLMAAFLTQKPAPGGGIPADESVWEMMPKDMRERRVRLPGGGWGLAADKEQAGKLAEGLRRADELKRNLARYTQLHVSGSPRIPSAIGGDAASAEQTLGTMIAHLKDMESLGAISPSDYNLINKQVPDITSWTTGNAAMEQKLSGLGRAIDDAVASHLHEIGVQ